MSMMETLIVCCLARTGKVPNGFLGIAFPLFLFNGNRL